jgi:hypothetical protein
MVLDPFTLLVLSAAMAAASALYLAAEWSSVRERSLLLWSAGFAIIAVGSVLALLRSSGYVLFGIWFPNGLLIVAHWLFLAGVAGFTRTRLPRTWWLLAVVWLAMLFLPDGPWWSKTMLGIQSLLIAVITLRAGLLLRPWRSAECGRGAAALRPAGTRPVLPGQGRLGRGTGRLRQPGQFPRRGDTGLAGGRRDGDHAARDVHDRHRAPSP